MNLLDFVFPKYCLGCNKHGEYFCSDCQKQIRKTIQICPVCHQPSIYGKTHKTCQGKDCLDGLTTIFVYEGIIKGAILKIKYKFITDLVKDLVEIAQEELKKNQMSKYRFFKNIINDKKTVVVPIPLHWYKENTRGFNQAFLLAKELSAYCKFSLNNKILKRKKFTVSQTTLSGKEREENVKDIFFITNNFIISPNIDYLLFDDVWTTGSTLKEAAELLKKAGAKKVWGFSLAR